MQEKIKQLYCLGLLALLMALLLTFSPLSARPAFASSSSSGKEIVISLSKQWMFVYQHGAQVYNSPVSTGRPTLRTPTGTYHVFAKFHPTTF
ncbi:MAG TPA: L,D-transpeptidase, partial [Ktedonobacteraceae bacterium]|nr:L,D-transpeptidase [Ktedonobacteraceae bacterium]